MGRSPCCDKTKVKRGPWSPEEDTILKNYIQKYGTGGNWIALPQKAGLKRCGKSCRLRWLNYLRPDIKLGCFTDEEDSIILNLYQDIGSRWSIIASHLPGRTDNDVKNYWNTKLKKKRVAAQGTSTTTTANNIFGVAPSPSTLVETIYSPEFNSSIGANINPAGHNMLPYYQGMLATAQIKETPENGEISYNYGLINNPADAPIMSEEAVSNFCPVSFPLENNAATASWSTTNGSTDVDLFLQAEMGSELMEYHLLNAFQYQEKFTDEIKYFITDEQQQPFHQSFTY